MNGLKVVMDASYPTNTFLGDYKKVGYVLIPNLLNDSETEWLYKSLVAERGEDCSENTNEIKEYSANLQQLLDPRKFFRRRVSGRNLLNATKLIRIARRKSLSFAYQDETPRRCGRIDSYFSPISEIDIIHWHCDQSFGGAPYPAEYFNGRSPQISLRPVNKVILYLTDVSRENGCLGYLPGSHLVGVALRSFMNKGRIKYQPFMDLRDAIMLVKSNSRDLVNEGSLDVELLRYFLDSGEAALSGVSDFSIPISRGGAVVFNDLGYHMAYGPKGRDRLVARFFYF